MLIPLLVCITGDILANGSVNHSEDANKFDKKIESSSAKLYFHYYGQLLHQQNMLQDYVRTGVIFKTRMALSFSIFLI